jgi:hypothetical protein
MKSSLYSLLVTLLMLTSLSGCSWLGMDDWFPNDPPPPPPDTRDFTKFPYEQMAPEAPPPPKPEFRTVRPNPADEFAWRRGYWVYKDGQGFIWNHGYWIRKPAFTAVWAPDFWLQRAYGWVLVPGHWE